MGEEYRSEKRCPDKCRDGCCLWCRWDSCQGYWVCYSRPCREKYEDGNGYAPVREKAEEDGYGKDAAPQKYQPREKYQSRKPVKEPEDEKEEYGGKDWGYGKETCREKDPCRKKEKEPCCGKESWWDPCCEEEHKKPERDKDCWCREEEHEKPKYDKDCWCCEEEHKKPERDKDCWCKEKHHDDPCCC